MASPHTEISFQNLTLDHAAWLMTLRELLEGETLARMGKPNYQLSDLAISLYGSLLAIVIEGADTALHNTAQGYSDAAAEQLVAELLGLARQLQDSVQQWQTNQARAAAVVATALHAQEVLAENYHIPMTED